MNLADAADAGMISHLCSSQLLVLFRTRNHPCVVRVHDQQSFRNSLKFTTILCSTSSTAFISSMTLLFAPSCFVFFTNFYFLPSRLIVSCTILASFTAFKMGVKNV